MTIGDVTKKEIIDGKAAFFYYGEIRYRDAFGNNRHTNFRFIADNEHKIGHLRWRSTEAGNESN